MTGVFQYWDGIDRNWNPGGLWRPVHVFDTGHFALEEAGDAIGEKVVAFLNRTVKPTHQSAR